MTTLTQTSTAIKNLGLRAGKVVAALVVLFILFKLGGAIFSLISPQPAIVPTAAFGKLPQFDLSEGVVVDNLNIRVDTISGDIPNLDTSAKVFAQVSPDITFGNLNQATQIATHLGFLPNSQDLGGGKVKFSDTKRPDRFLTMELASNNFNFTSNFLGDISILDSKPKSTETVQSAAVKFLQNFGFSAGEFPANKITAVFYTTNGGNLVKTDSLSSANVVKIIFKPADLDSSSVDYINEADPLIWVIVSDKDILAGEKALVQIQKNKFATYPLKGATVAFEQLKQGRGVLNKQPNDNNFVVRNVKIAYVASRKYQPYLEPVYIFEGNDGVNAYVGAVSDSWVETN